MLGVKSSWKKWCKNRRSKVNVDSPNVNALHSILDIGGTQMMFILPDAPAVVAPKMLEKCLLRYKEQQQQQNKRISSGPGIGGSTSFQMFDKAHLTHSLHLFQQTRSNQIWIKTCQKRKPKISSLPILMRQ